MNRKSLLACVAVLAAILGGASPSAAATVVDVTVERARALLDQPRGGLVVLDVRTPEEFAQGHLKGAVNLDAMAPDFERRAARLDRGKPYLVYCRSGNRSARAVQIMTRLGFTTISHMTEGVVGWQAKRLPLVR